MMWFGKLPERWDVEKISGLFTERQTKVSDSDFEPLSVSKGGIVPQIATVAKSNAGDNRKLVCKGDFVINSRSDRRGSSGVSQYDGSVSLINIVLEPRKEENGRYYHYLLRSHNFIEEYYRNGRGIVADLWTTRYSEMKTIYLPLPPRNEQDQIVRYLDWKVSQINKLINAKRRQTALLQEQKQAIIDRAITKGLIPDGMLKDSGVSWLGQVSEHFTVQTLRRIVKFVESGTSVNSIDGSAGVNEVGVLSTSCVYGNGFDVDKNKRVAPFDLHRVTCPVKAGTVIISRMNTPDLVGASGFVAQSNENVFLPDRLWQVTFCNNANPEYVALYLSSSYVRKWFSFTATGSSSSMKNLAQNQFLDTVIPLPDAPMQKRILTTSKLKSEKIDSLVMKIEIMLASLIEYRTRLISDVVTGKLDVRGVVVPEYEVLEDAAEDTEEFDDELGKMEGNS